MTPIYYLDGKHAVSWAFLLASRGDLLAARDELARVPPKFTEEHLAILDAAHRRRFGRPLPHGGVALPTPTERT
jgi:hypothetical protein